MKIMHVCKKYPHALGGDAVVVSNLQKQQEAAGHNVVIITSNCDEIRSDKGVYKFGLKDTPAKLDAITPQRLASLVMLFFRMFFILRKERPDVIHTHSIDMAFIVSFAARFYGIAIVHTFHIVTFYDATQHSSRRKTELWFAKKARLRIVTAPNMYDVERLRAAGLEQTQLLSNGVDLEFWRKDLQAKKSSTFEFLAIGRLERQKGYENLIKAAALLADSKPAHKFHVTIVGEGSQETTLRRLIHILDAENIVTLEGRKNPEEVRSLLSWAGAAVFPSLYETTPITLLEAWSVAAPVITTAVGILHNASKDFDAAYIVPLEDERALMQAMSHCMADEHSRLTVAAEGSKEAQKYAWPTIARTAESIYGNAL